MAGSSRVVSRAVGKFLPPPAPLSAAIAADGVTLTVVYSQNVTSADFTAGFSLTADGDPVSIISGGVAGDTVTYTTDTVLQDQVCALAYDAGTGDVAGTYKPLSSFTMAVTNNSTQTGGGPVVCAIALNASQGAVQGAGFTDRLTLSNNDQSFDYTIQGGLGSPANFAAMPAVLLPLDASAGTKVFEWVLDAEPTFSGGAASTLALQAMTLYTSELSAHIQISRSYKGDGTKGLSVLVDETPVYSSADIAVSRIGVELVAGTGTLIVMADDVRLVLSAEAYTAQALTPVVTAGEVPGVDSGYTGQHISSTFVTDADSITGTYTGGATDCCDTPLATDARLADVLMLVDFSEARGTGTVADAANAEVYTLAGGATVENGYLVCNNAGYAYTADTALHDPGLAPDTLELDGVNFTSTSGLQTLVSNYDGTAVAASVQYNSGALYYNLATGGNYPFTWTPSTGTDYRIRFSRNGDGDLSLYVNEVLIDTVTGVTDNIMGSTGDMYIGGLYLTGSVIQKFNGKIRAVRLTDGAARTTDSANFPHFAEAA